MSETASPGRYQEINQREDRQDPVAVAHSRSKRRRWVTATVVLVVLGAGAGATWSAGVFRSHGSSSGNTGASPPQTYPVTRQNISETTSDNAALGYAASYTVTGQGGGTLTWLPPAGQVIRQGQVLYRTDNGTPTILIYGGVPAWRTMSAGTTGEDVTQLNHGLVDLGYANSSDISALGWDYYSWETNYAVQQMEEARGVSSPSGSLSLGSVVFTPEALRVRQLTGSLGSPASGPILSATSDRHVVTINLSTDMESEVKAGDAVTVELPNTLTTPGVITSVGTVASGSSNSPTVPVDVKLTNSSAAGSWDEAPVTVNITTASVSNVLAVPVTALMAQPSGAYEVEVVEPGNTRSWVTVTLGLFDQTTGPGLVQVTGNLTPGERVVVPNI